MYLNYDSPEAFIDYPKRTPVRNLVKECPKCKGHGGWNLRLNAYPLNDKANTSENRHYFSHFRCTCANCFGWGYVLASQTCVHEYKRTASLGMCNHVLTCKCEHQITLDSSD